MKLKSHVLVGVGYVVVSGSFEPIAVAAISAGSIFPDIFDSLMSMGSEKLFKWIHRKVTHWWILYLIPLLAMLFWGFGNYAVYYFLIGSFLHVFCDSFTRSGVPFINPFKAGFGFRLFVNGSIGEYIALLLILLVFAVTHFLLSMPAWLLFIPLMVISVFYRRKRAVKKEKKEKIIISLADLAPLWTEKQAINHQQATTVHKTEESARFNKKEIQKFYREHVATLPANARNVIEQILTLLDEKGDCPSVVRRQGELNNYEEPNTFAALAQVPLFRHSLHVAEEILKLVDKPGAYAAQLLIVALGHDLGKIESFDRAIYSMGDHPRISVVVLTGMSGFTELSYRADVETAILSHHRTGGGDLADQLREADRNARKKELADNLIRLDAGDYYESPAVSENVSIFQPKQTETVEEKKPSESSDLAWLDISEFLVELDQRINQVSGTRFEAFSMKDGHVYIQTDTFWKVLKMLARKHNKEVILLADADQQQRRNYIYTITEMLREKKYIADGIIQRGYFTAPFTVEYKDGSTIKKAYYTPMVSEAFGDVSALEKRKTGVLLEIVSVYPKYGDNK